MKKFLTILLLVCSTSAFAWGDRERAATIGLGVGIFLGHQIYSYNQPAPVYINRYPQPPMYVPPAHLPTPRVYVAPYGARACLQHPVYDGYGRLIGYEYSCH